MSISLELNDAINYEVKQSSHPSYRMSRVLPQGNSEVTLLSGATSSTTFQIPNVVYNLKKSTLDFRMELSRAVEDDMHNVLYSMGPPIDSIVLASRENTEIFRVDNADIYCAAVLPYLVAREDFMTFPNSRGSTESTIGAAVQIATQELQKGFNFFPNDTVRNETATANGSCQRESARIQNGSYAVNERAYSEMQYFRVATIDYAVVVNYSFPLWTIAPHTLASRDLDLYFGQSLQLTVNFSSTQNIGFSSGSSTAIMGVAVVPPVPQLYTPLAISGMCQMKDLSLQLSVETNQRLAELVKERVMTQGMKLFVPFVRSYSYNIGLNTEGPSITQRLSLNNGQRLLCVYNLLMNSNSTREYRHDKTNNDQDKCSSYQVQLNSLNLSENRINCRNGDDWSQIHRELCQKSCITDHDVYNHNRVNVISFREGRCVDWLDSDGVIDGIDLLEEQTLTVDQSSPSQPARQYYFVVTQKLLNIDPSGAISMQ